MLWFKKKLATGAAQGVASHIAATYILPLGLPVVTGWLGYVEGLPLMYIFVGVGVMFAATATGLLRYSEWRELQRVEGKLGFQSVIVGRDIKGGGINVGLQFASLATFPLEFEVTEMKTRLGDKIPALEHKAKRISLPATGIGWCNNNPIELNNPPNPGTIEGSIEFRVKYGPPGSSLEYGFSGKKQVVAMFNDDGLLTQSSWVDAI